MKKINLISIILFHSLLFSQDFGTSQSCHVNNQNYWIDLKKANIEATFKLNIEGNCSATLINRNVPASELGNYFITARHCVKDVDFSKDHYLYFNYQSPTANSDETFLSNRGIISYPQNIDNTILEQIQSYSLNENNYEYAHISKLRLVDSEFWGDFALCEILTPLPPHFNVSYAGWNSSLNFSGGIDIMGLCGTPVDYYGVHHPSGDIKKLSTTNHFIKGETPIATGCYVVTTVIDVLFGWIWGNSVSTSLVCNFVDNPWLIVPHWCSGGIENGSSGSGFFNMSGKLTGILSGGIFECSSFAAITTYGKFRNNYFRTTVKNTLNPSNELLVDLVGLPARKITCYHDLTLPGVPGVSNQYFPANHYQADNIITLQALNDITIEKNIV